MTITQTTGVESAEHNAITLALAKKESAQHVKGIDQVYKAMRQKPLLVQAYALNDTTAPSSSSPYGPNVKLCHFLRHGQGFHNLMADMASAQGRDWTQFEISPENPYVMPEIVDAPLTQKGRIQARAVQPIVRQFEHQPELIVLSSQCRAIQTGLIAFEELAKHESVPFLAHEMLREETGVHVCDRRRPKSQQMLDFPRVNFDLVLDEEDALFLEDRRETKMEVGKRVYSFLEWLEKRDETVVSIASHSGWLLTLFNGVVECDDALKKWFQTGELRSVKLVFDRSET